MSSIYKKGRDGYFYYQAYLYNPKTGKKDKRIYHSLNTKNRLKAIEKQANYDLKYENKYKRLITFANKYTISFLIVSVIIFFYSELKLTGFQESEKTSSVSEKKNSVSEKKSKIDLGKSRAIENQLNKPNLVEDEPTKLDALRLPKYQVIRIEESSSDLNQVKVYATVSAYSKGENLELVCKRIKRDFSSFSNLIICLYSDTKNGLALAKGQTNASNITNEENEWIAMYTHNSFENDYFDNDPTAYKNIYRTKK